jgi:hypothetical protein
MGWAETDMGSEEGVLEHREAELGQSVPSTIVEFEESGG